MSEPPEDWAGRGVEWALGVLGILEAERELRANEHECLSRLRSRGVIR